MFLESWQMKKWIVAIIYLFIVVGCAQPETVSKVEIMTLSEKWKEPKVAIWYYKGSDEKYHYFKYGSSEKLVGKNIADLKQER
jgi:hypothetical protein